MFNIFCAVCFIFLTEWPPIRKIAAHSTYDMFSWYKYLIVGLFVFSHLGFWSGNLFLIAPFPDLLSPVISTAIISVHLKIREIHISRIARLTRRFQHYADDFLYRLTYSENAQCCSRFLCHQRSAFNYA